MKKQSPEEETQMPINRRCSTPLMMEDLQRCDTIRVAVKSEKTRERRRPLGAGTRPAEGAAASLTSLGAARPSSSRRGRTERRPRSQGDAERTFTAAQLSHLYETDPGL